MVIELLPSNSRYFYDIHIVFLPNRIVQPDINKTERRLIKRQPFSHAFKDCVHALYC